MFFRPLLLARGRRVNARTHARTRRAAPQRALRERAWPPSWRAPRRRAWRPARAAPRRCAPALPQQQVRREGARARGGAHARGCNPRGSSGGAPGRRPHARTHSRGSSARTGACRQQRADADIWGQTRMHVLRRCRAVLAPSVPRPLLAPHARGSPRLVASCVWAKWAKWGRPVLCSRVEEGGGCCLVERFPMPFTDPAGCQGTRVWVGSKAGGWPRTLVVAASVVIRRGSDRPRERGPLPSRCVAAWRAASRWRALARFVTKSARSSPCLSSWSRHRLARTNAHALRV